MDLSEIEATVGNTVERDGRTEGRNNVSFRDLNLLIPRHPTMSNHNILVHRNSADKTEISSFFTLHPKSEVNLQELYAGKKNVVFKNS